MENLRAQARYTLARTPGFRDFDFFTDPQGSVDRLARLGFHQPFFCCSVDEFLELQHVLPRTTRVVLGEMRLLDLELAKKVVGFGFLLRGLRLKPLKLCLDLC